VVEKYKDKNFDEEKKPGRPGDDESEDKIGRERKGNITKG
jgi:hypothetical protein